MKNILDIYKNILFKPGKLTKKLIVIIIIKLFIMFAILKLFLFPDFMKKNFPTDKERSDYIINKLNKYDRH